MAEPGGRPLRTGLGHLARPEMALILVAGLLEGIGVTAILAAWHGAAGTVLLAEQLPYLISGGILGVAFVFVGSLAYFGHVQAGSVRDARAREQQQIRRHHEVMTALERLGERIATGA